MSLPRSAASSPGRSPAPIPNTTIASAEARFAGSRWAAATAASSARSGAEYGTGALCCPSLKIPMKAALVMPMWGCGKAPPWWCAAGLCGGGAGGCG